MADNVKKSIEIVIDSKKAKKGADEVVKSTDKVKKGMIATDKSTAKLNKSFNSLGSGAGRLTSTLIKLVGVYVGFRTLKTAITLFAQFEETMATIAGVTSATISDLERLEATARKLGASTRYSAKQAAEGLLFLSRAGFTVEEAIQALPATLNLATAGIIDLGYAADIASNVLSQFRLKANETERVVDTLVNTANSANTNVEQLAEAMKMAGPVAGALGLSVEETAAAIGVLGDSGIQASMAGTNMRGMLAALLGPTSKVESIIKKLGLSMKDVSPATNDLVTIMKKLKDAHMSASDAVEIFGRRNAAAALTITASIDKFYELIDANNEAGGTAAKNAALIEKTLSGSFKNLKSVIEELILKLTGDSGFGMSLKSVIDSVVSFLRGIDSTMINTVAFWSKAWESMKSVTEAVWVAFEVSFNNAVYGFRAGVMLMLDVLSMLLKEVGESWAWWTGDETSKFATWAVDINSTRQALELLNIKMKQNDELNYDVNLDQIAIDGRKKILEIEINRLAKQSELRNGLGVYNTGLKEAIDNTKKLSQEEYKAQSFAIAGSSFEYAYKKGTSTDTIAKYYDQDSISIAALIIKEQERNKLLGLSEKQVALLKTEEKALNQVREEANRLVLDENILGEDKVTFVKDYIASKQTQIEELKNEIEKRYDLIKVMTEQKKQMQRVQQMYNAFSNVIASAFANIVSGAKSAKESTADLIKAVGQLAIQYAIVKPLANALSGGFGSLFGGVDTNPTSAASSMDMLNAEKSMKLIASAKGNMFNNGSLIPFANGGIVNSPTTFPMSGNKTGLMGENGAEAIVPLQRDSQGRLGMGGGVNVTFNVSTPDADSFKKSQKQLVSKAKRSFM